MDKRLAFFIGALLILASVGFAADQWVIENNGVYWNNSIARISVYPATSHNPVTQEQYVNFSYFGAAPATVNMTFVFDQPITAGNVYLLQNLTTTRYNYYQGRANYTLNFLVANSTIYAGSAPCDIGDALNTFKYNVTLVENSTRKIACFNSVTNVSNNYTISFSLDASLASPYSHTKQVWNRITDMFVRGSYGNYRTFTINNVPFTNGTLYQTKFVYDTPSPLTSGKFSIYVHAGSPAQVLAHTAPVYIELDPWWDVGNSSANASYWIGGSSDNGMAVWIAQSNYTGVTDTSFYVYYGGQVNNSNINTTFVFADDFDNGAVDATKWNTAGTVTESGGTAFLSNTVSSQLRALYLFPINTSILSNLTWLRQEVYFGFYGKTLAFTDNDDFIMFHGATSIGYNRQRSTKGGTETISNNAMDYGVYNLTRVSFVNQTTYATQNSTFRLNSSLIANHSTNVPDYNMSFRFMHLNTVAANFYIDWVIAYKDYNSTPTQTYGLEETGNWTHGTQTFSKRKLITVNPAFNFYDYNVYVPYKEFNNTALFITGGSGASVPPVVTFSSQNYDITSANVFGKTLNITYSISDADGINGSATYLLYKTNTTGSDISFLINGTAYSGWQNGTNFTNSTALFSFYLQDRHIYPATYNYNETVMESTAHQNFSLNSTAQYVKVQLLNLSNTSNYSILEITSMNNSLSSPLRIYYCNSSYAAGDPTSSANCILIFNLLNNATYNHTHSAFSGHHVIPVPINATAGTLGGVVVTNTSYFLIRGASGGWNTSFINFEARPDAIQVSTNDGGAWTSLPITIDAHLHQYNGSNTFRYQVCAKDNVGLETCGTERTDSMELDGIPPSSPVITYPTAGLYNRNITIQYNRSISPTSINIATYRIELLNSNGSVNKTIVANNYPALSYNWDWASEGVRPANYSIGITAIDSNGYVSYDYSGNFELMRFLVNATPLQTSNASYGSNISWVYRFSIEGSSLCYVTIPASWSAFWLNTTLQIYNATGTNLTNTPYTNATEYKCNETSAQFNMTFNTTNPVAFVFPNWTQNNQTTSNVSRQYILQNTTLNNTANFSLENVTFTTPCFDANTTCTHNNDTDMAAALFGNYTQWGYGDYINESNITVNNSMNATFQPYIYNGNTTLYVTANLISNNSINISFHNVVWNWTMENATCYDASYCNFTYAISEYQNSSRTAGYRTPITVNVTNYTDLTPFIYATGSIITINDSIGVQITNIGFAKPVLGLHFSIYRCTTDVCVRTDPAGWEATTATVEDGEIRRRDDNDTLSTFIYAIVWTDAAGGGGGGGGGEEPPITDTCGAPISVTCGGVAQACTCFDGTWSCPTCETIEITEETIVATYGGGGGASIGNTTITKAIQDATQNAITATPFVCEMLLKPDFPTLSERTRADINRVNCEILALMNMKIDAIKMPLAFLLVIVFGLVSAYYFGKSMFKTRFMALAGATAVLFLYTNTIIIGYAAKIFGI